MQQDGSLLLFLAGTRVAHAKDGAIETLVDGLPGEETARFNDVIVDAVGRVICGVLPTDADGSGSIHSFSSDGSEATKLHDDMRLPNGMAFSLDGNVLYVADTRAGHVLAFDYDVASGTVANPRTFIKLEPDDGHPDGITVDAEGCVWVAQTGGWCVARYDSSGKQVESVTLPARKPTSVGFGGDDMNTLFVTSSSREATPGEELGPEAGALFAFSPGISGPRERRTNWHTV